MNRQYFKMEVYELDRFTLLILPQIYRDKHFRDCRVHSALFRYNYNECRLVLRGCTPFCSWELIKSEA